MTQKKNVVIIGGGTAGITIASRLKKASGAVNIKIVDPAERHYY